MIVKRIVAVFAALAISSGVFTFVGGFSTASPIPIAAGSTGDGDCNWQDC